MPGIDGPEIIRKLRSEPRETYTYVLLLTARAQKDEVLGGLEAGADDYLVKPFDAGELLARIQVGQRIIELEHRLIKLCDQARFQAEHDALTEILNRRAILKVLDRELSRASRESTATAVLLADVDHFKQVNDVYGHPAGDMTLRSIAQVLHKTLRPYDQVGRYGGEEFVVVAPKCGLAEAVGLAERIRTSVNAVKLRVAAGVEIQPSISIGVAVGNTTSSDNLLRSADTALYRAKSSGRNCVRVDNDLLFPLGYKWLTNVDRLLNDSQSLSQASGGSHE
jgi:diguanylate cyclase (GGDEF)-like protein